MIHFFCPHCREEFDVYDEMAGDTSLCDGCKKPITVPGEKLKPEMLGAMKPYRPKNHVVRTAIGTMLSFAIVFGLFLWGAMVLHNRGDNSGFPMVIVVGLLWIFAIICFAIGPFITLKGPNQFMVCPHCQSKGTVVTRAVRVKKGIDGTKAAGAILTGGLSLPLTGLSRRENMTEARCQTCGSIWNF